MQLCAMLVFLMLLYNVRSKIRKPASNYLQRGAMIAPLLLGNFSQSLSLEAEAFVSRPLKS